MSTKAVIASTPELRSARLTMKPLTAEPLDITNQFSILGNQEVNGPLATIFSQNKPVWVQAKLFCETAHQLNTAGEGYLTAVSADARVIGYIGIANTDANYNPKKWEIGYWFHRAEWGKGYAPEAVARMIKFAKEDLGLSGLFATTSTENRRSGAVLLRSGFIKANLTLTMMTADKEHRPSHRYDLNFS